MEIWLFADEGMVEGCWNSSKKGFEPKSPKFYLLIYEYNYEKL
ncbi:hypothetical protein [Bacillus sp. 2205SS5-2]